MEESMYINVCITVTITHVKENPPPPKEKKKQVIFLKRLFVDSVTMLVIFISLYSEESF